MKEFKYPRNETKEHFLLKEIAKYILFGWGYNKLATEVGGMWSYDFMNFNPSPKRDFKSIIDAVGVRKMSKFVPKQGTQYYFDVKGIEAKASLSDFKNGFCAAPAYTYIIAPKGVIPVNLIPGKIGFIEVDLNNFVLPKNSQRIPDMKGIELVKKARKRIDGRFRNEESYRQWCKDVIEAVAYRASSELLFRRNILELV